MGNHDNTPISHMELVRYHEAGHAVLFHNFGLGIDKIILFKDGSGCVLLVNEPRTMDERLASICSLLAGTAAQTKQALPAGMNPFCGGSKDFDLAISEISYSLNCSKILSCIIAVLLFKEVKALTQNAPIQQQITAVAKALKQTDCLFNRQFVTILQNCSQQKQCRNVCLSFLRKVQASFPLIVAQAHALEPHAREALTQLADELKIDPIN